MGILKRFRDAVSGRYTTAADAAARPSETVGEAILDPRSFTSGGSMMTDAGKARVLREAMKREVHPLSETESLRVVRSMDAAGFSIVHLPKEPRS